MDKRKDFSLCIYEFSPIIFKLVQARCPPYLDWKADLFFITLGHSLRSQRSACKLMVSEKTITDRMGLFNSRHIYNKQITA